MIDWGIYKSNKVFYHELEEEKKLKRSLFGFSCASISKSFKLEAKQKNIEKQPQFNTPLE